VESGFIDDGNCRSRVDFHLNWSVVDVEGDGEWRRTFIVNGIKAVFIPNRIVLLFWLLLDIVCPLWRLLMNVSRNVMW